MLKMRWFLNAEKRHFKIYPVFGEKGISLDVTPESYRLLVWFLVKNLRLKCLKFRTCTPRISWILQ